MDPSFSLQANKQKRRLRVFENRVLRRIFAPKSGAVTEK
jgi:hypothetical protein